MATDKQISANIKNAKKSTGPKSKRGIGFTRRNAITHGFYAKHLVIEDGRMRENQDDFNVLEKEANADIEPVGFRETFLASKVVEIAWKDCRLKRYEKEEFRRIEAQFEDEVTNLSEYEFKNLKALLVGDDWPLSIEFSVYMVWELKKLLEQSIRNIVKSGKVSEHEGKRLYHVFRDLQPGCASKDEFLKRASESVLGAELLRIEGLLERYEEIRKAVRLRLPEPPTLPPREITDKLLRLQDFSDNRFFKTLRELNSIQDRRKATEKRAAKGLGKDRSSGVYGETD